MKAVALTTRIHKNYHVFFVADAFKDNFVEGRYIMPDPDTQKYLVENDRTEIPVDVCPSGFDYVIMNDGNKEFPFETLNHHILNAHQSSKIH